MGCGFLGIPSAFVKSGLLLGPLLILFGGVVMNATKDYVLEAMARAEAMAKAADVSRRALRHAAAGDTAGLAGAPGHKPALIVPEKGDYVIHDHRKFEVTDLCLMLVGPTARSVYAVILSMYMYGGLCAYASVWASSFSANVPIPFLNGGATCNIETSGLGGPCTGPYLLWLAVFAAVAIPLACMDLEEQVGVQVAMFAARVLVVLLLTGTVAVGLGSCDGVVFAEVPPGKPRPTPLFDAAGLATVIPVSIFSFIFHHSIPGLSAPVADKVRLPRMFATAFAIITLFYASVGLLVAAFFGESVNSQCSLNWRQYVGCMPRPANYTLGGSESISFGSGAGARRLLTALAGAVVPGFSQQHSNSGGLASAYGLSAPACSGPDSWADDGSCVDWQARPTYAHIISFIVLIFPALDVLSAFPLNAITLGNNLMSALLGEKSLIAPIDADDDGEDDDSDGEGEEEDDSDLLGDVDTTAYEREQARLMRSGGGSGGSGLSNAICRKKSGGSVGGGSSGGRRKGRRKGGAGQRRTPTSPILSGPLPWYLRSRRNHWWTKVGFRLLAAVPPVVVTAFVSDLGVILTFTGLVGVAIAFTIPAMLRLFGLAKQRAMFGLVSHALLPEAQLATSADVDSAVPLKSVRTPAMQEAVTSAAEAAKAASVEAGAGVDRGGSGSISSSVGSLSGASPQAQLLASGGHGDDVIEAVCAAAKGVPVGLREAVTSLPHVDDVIADTPYTSWAARGRGAELLLGASLVVFAYVFVQTVITVAASRA